MTYFQTHLPKLIKYLLFLTAFTPLVVGSAIFLHTFDKLIFFRVLIELALILFFIHIFIIFHRKDTALITHYSLLITKLFKSPIFIFLVVFFLSLLISAAFGVNPYRSFWGDLERGEGFFGLIHYFLFFLLAIIIFNKEHWLTFCKLFVLAGIIISFLAFLQLPYLNIGKLPYAIDATERPGSLLGNSAYLSSYLLFVILFAIIIFIRSKDDSGKHMVLWRYSSLFIAFFAAIAIFFTKTRGTLVGLTIAFIVFFLYFIFIKEEKIFLFRSQFSLRRISMVIIAAIAIFFATFFMTKENDFWRLVPGFDRLAKVDVFNNKDASTIVRLAGWKIAWQSFLEKPILGWGPESYVYIFNKKYDPNLALYGDVIWLDRSHNKILDILSAQGIIGFLSYIGIFIALLFGVFASKNIQSKLKPVLMSGIVAYVVQNIFVFDNISSYIGFFALIGFLISESSPSQVLQKQNLGGQADAKRLQDCNPPAGGARLQIPGYRLLATKTLILIVIVIVSYSMYAYNYIPYRQAYQFWNSTKLNNVDEVVAVLKKAMYPYNFAQDSIRTQGLESIYLKQYFTNQEYVSNPHFDSLGDMLLTGMRELANKEISDVRILIKTVEALNGIARDRPEKSAELYKEAESILKKAIVISPKRQEVYYHLAFNLANQNRFDESIQIAKYAVALAPASQAHYQLGLMYHLADRNEEAFQEFARVEEIDSRFNRLFVEDINNMLLIYSKFSKNDKIAEMVNKIIGDNRYIIKTPFVLIAFKYYASIKDRDNFIKIAEYLKPAYEEAMPIFIELAEKGLWETINKSL